MNLTSLLGSIPGAAKMLGSLTDIAQLKTKAAAKLGVSPAVLDEFAQEAQAILADGTITKDEVATRLKSLATAKGIPPQVIDAVLQMMPAVGK